MAAHTHATILLEQGEFRIPIDDSAAGPGYVILYHGSCRRCHHFHTARVLTLPLDQNAHVQYPCEHCGHPLFGAGRTSTHASLSSLLTSSSWNLGTHSNEFITRGNDLLPVEETTRPLDQESPSAATSGTPNVECHNLSEGLQARQDEIGHDMHQESVGTLKQMIRSLFIRIKRKPLFSRRLFPRQSTLRRTKASMKHASTMTSDAAALDAPQPSDSEHQAPLESLQGNLSSAVPPNSQTNDRDPIIKDSTRRVENKQLYARRKELTLRKYALSRSQHSATGRATQENSSPAAAESIAQDSTRSPGELTPSEAPGTQMTQPLARPAYSNMFAHAGMHLDPSYNISSSLLTMTSDRNTEGQETDVLAGLQEADVDAGEMASLTAPHRPNRFFRRHQSLPSTPLHDVLYFVANARPEVIHAIRADQEIQVDGSDRALVDGPRGESTRSMTESARAATSASLRQAQPSLHNGTNPTTPQEHVNGMSSNLDDRHPVHLTDSGISVLQLGTGTSLPNNGSPPTDITE